MTMSTASIVAQRPAEGSDDWGDAFATSATLLVVLGVFVVVVVIVVALVAISGGARKRARARFVDEPLRHRPTSIDDATWEPDATVWNSLDPTDADPPPEPE